MSIPRAGSKRVDIGGGVRKGRWNAQDNQPTLASGVYNGNTGDYYFVSTTGSTLIDGINDWRAGDRIIWQDDHWEQERDQQSANAITEAELAAGVMSKSYSVTPVDGDIREVKTLSGKSTQRREQSVWVETAETGQSITSDGFYSKGVAEGLKHYNPDGTLKDIISKTDNTDFIDYGDEEDRTFIIGSEIRAVTPNGETTITINDQDTETLTVGVDQNQLIAALEIVQGGRIKSFTVNTNGVTKGRIVITDTTRGHVIYDTTNGQTNFDLGEGATIPAGTQTIILNKRKAVRVQDNSTLEVRLYAKEAAIVVKGSTIESVFKPDASLLLQTVDFDLMLHDGNLVERINAVLTKVIKDVIMLDRNSIRFVGTDNTNTDIDIGDHTYLYDVSESAGNLSLDAIDRRIIILGDANLSVTIPNYAPIGDHFKTLFINKGTEQRIITIAKTGFTFLQSRWKYNNVHARA